ncbi:MAG: replication-associated recombination protein A [Verrucomicrobiae bacterium]|nr:replication-associated recombination protein A [Verrucomicrobiae bacterium]
MSDRDKADDLFGPEGDSTGLNPGTDPLESEEAPAISTVDASQPLAARMRPRNLDEYVGQRHILGEGKLLRRAVEADRFTSLIFYGPPGVGKTSLAELIARRTESRFINLSGVESNVAEIRKAVEAARSILRTRKLVTTLFVDEIHRFNKAQQDVLLPHIERGTVRFIGATTHNPFFYINSPLVSRSQVFQLEPLEEIDLAELLQAAIHDPERGFGKLALEVSEEAAAHLVRMCDGDARKLLTSFELAVLTTDPDEENGNIVIDLEVAEDSIQRKTIVYDADGDAHYDTISAFIKSIRGSDPDAALYWLAKMLHAGEDIRFIARRLVISASEDIGMADSNGLRVAVAAQQAVEFIGMPEARIPLAHATVYLATAPKSNRAYAAIDRALKDVREGRTLPVPAHLRTKTRKKLGVEGGALSESETAYQYSHDYEGAYVPQAYLPEGRVYYEPGEQGMEKRVAERLEYWRAQFEAAQHEEQT